MGREPFERLVRAAAHRPVTAEAVLGELVFQTLFFPNPDRSGLDELAGALLTALSGRLSDARDRLSDVVRQYPDQPLCYFYLFAAQCQAGDRGAAVDTLGRVSDMRPEDPLVDLLLAHFAGKAIPPTTQSARLAFLRKFASTTILRNAYLLAVGAVFEAIKGTAHARVLDIGVGSGAQMCELLGLLERRRHRVRRLDILGLDVVDEFLRTAADAIAARSAQLAPDVAVSFQPVKAHIEELDPSTAADIVRGGPLDAANATITLHEVPGERKIDALRNLRGLRPKQVVLVEWNCLLENILPETTVEFFFNIRHIATAWAVGLQERYPLAEAHDVVRAVLAQGEGQLTCPAALRQECYLDAGCWKALLEHTGFSVTNPSATLLEFADRPDRAALDAVPWRLAAYRDRSVTPLVLLEAVPT